VSLLLLTAQTISGKTICLGSDYQKEVLVKLRASEEFICPICGEAVLLKLGNQRIYHFAHRSGHMCREFYERETVYHMEGKRQLFQWLVDQGLPVALEYYDKDIQQRPDIIFKYNGKKFALEYQCSPISEEVFQKRTNAYYQQNYIPLWIIGHKQLKMKKSNVLSLTSFNYYFIRKSMNGQYFIPSYSPENKLFHIFGSFLPYSIRNTFTRHNQFPIHTISVNNIIEPILPNPCCLKEWDKEIERFKLNCSMRPSPEQKRFLHEIYLQHLNLFLLPPEIGLPVRHSLLIQTPTIIWQTYLYLDFIQYLSPNDYIDLKDVERTFYRRMRNKDIMMRELPQISNESPFRVVVEYFQQLEKVGIVSQKGQFIFQLNRRFAIPKSNREREEQKKYFDQNYFNQTLLKK
jgi:competence protein CoiA